MIGTAVAGLILGLGSVTIGSSLVQASERGGLFDFFQELFAPALPQPAPQVHRPGRYANLPNGRRLGVPRPLYHTPRPVADLALGRSRRARARARSERAAPVTVAVASTGRRTVCVRMCDGYLFPLGTLGARADMPVHEAACAAACPGAPTNVYTLGARETELDRAISPQGLPYRASALANIYRQRRVENCSCQAAPGTTPLPVANDLTLRKGDVVATHDSADVVTRSRSGSVALVDFRQAAITRGQSRRIEAKVGAIRRDAEARAFRRTLRTAERASLVQVASVGDGFRIPARAVGAQDEIRVVTPSPFR
ncbi:DUF2865 domain-containing protein [Methylobacterium sp. WL12]|uniref:DUF2865 domain-containing protein n=1 Tax=Methylobacterium sp. WL12 TaxID=2603890 RepID=UPI001650D21F|nr:DUF2865 domain-containing protein [Methylobacterium sp. WL12]